jgi:predicted permease
MGRTAINLWSQDRGFQAEGVLTLRMEVPPPRYDAAGLRAVYARLIERLAPLPGIDNVSVSNCIPGEGRCRRTNVREVDGRLLDSQRSPTVGVNYISARHFDLLRTPLLRGRGFDDRDSPGSPLTIIVNESAAARLWPGEDAVGRRLALYFADGMNTESREVVGVVHNVQFEPVETDPQPDVYLPATQIAWGASALLLRLHPGSRVSMDDVRAGIADVDADIAVHDVAPLTSRLGAGFAIERLLTAVLATLAAAALTLAAIGIHGLVAHAVGRSLREVGIRMALGASRGHVVRLIVGRAGTVLGLGLATGVLAALVTGRVLSAFLFGVGPRDPSTLAGILLLVAAALVVALAGPLRRAALVDPAIVLRTD